MRFHFFSLRTFFDNLDRRHAERNNIPPFFLYFLFIYFLKIKSLLFSLLFFSFIMFSMDHASNESFISPKPILVNSPTIATSILQPTDSRRTVDSLKINLSPDDPHQQQQQQQQQQTNNMDDFEIKQPIGNTYT